MRSSPSRQAELRRLIARRFAHRGLHGPDRIENSRAAFAAAIAAGHGIELDVQASRDGEAMVFHDARLERLTGEAGPVAARPAAALARIPLNGSDETIPTLGEVLALVAGRAPLLIELKAPGLRAAPLCRSVARALADYDGPAAVMSFNPLAVRWFARHAPDRLRGLVVTEGKRPRKGLARRLGALALARPDFLAWDVRDLPSRLAAALRARGRPLLTWTCRDARTRAAAAAHADQMIYEL
jgi:glycerophosphoryl diester phosphodiesterase